MKKCKSRLKVGFQVLLIEVTLPASRNTTGPVRRPRPLISFQVTLKFLYSLS